MTDLKMFFFCDLWFCIQPGDGYKPPKPVADLKIYKIIFELLFGILSLYIRLSTELILKFEICPTGLLRTVNLR